MFLYFFFFCLENKFIKEKEDTITNYENAIRDLKADLGKEIKHKTEENKKLIEDLKAKEIVSGSLDKLKTMEDSFTHIVEFVKSKSSAFEVINFELSGHIKGSDSLAEIIKLKKKKGVKIVA